MGSPLEDFRAAQALRDKRRAWENGLCRGARVRVSWGYGSGFRASGLAEIVRFNMHTVRVRLVENVASGPRVGWLAGTFITVPRCGPPYYCIAPLPQPPLLRSKDHLEVKP